MTSKYGKNKRWLRCYRGGVTIIIIIYGVCVEGASVNVEFRKILARRLKQSRVSAALWSNLIAIRFGAAEACRMNWA